jgi:hypothetical protein
METNGIDTTKEILDVAIVGGGVSGIYINSGCTGMIYSKSVKSATRTSHA